MDKNNVALENLAPADLETLLKMYKAVKDVPADVQNALVTSPVESVEKSISKYTQDALDVSKADFEFNDAIQKEILTRLPSMDNSELILLITNNKVNDSDRLSKIFGPAFQLMISKQNAEIAAMNAQTKAAEISAATGSNPQSSNYRNLNDDASKELLHGMTKLTNMFNLVMSDYAKKKEQEEAIIVEPIKDSENSENNNSEN